MRDLRELRRFAVATGEDGGAFVVQAGAAGRKLRIIASEGMGWDHVSVSLGTRTPTWAEMSLVHRLFFRPDEAAMQLHVPLADHVNRHEHCLHLWRPQGVPIPRPESWMV